MLFLLAPGAALSQGADRARFVGEGSFSLPGEESAEGPDQPVALAVGPSGSVHVADRRGGVAVFDSVGRFVRTYGPGRNSRPVAVAVDTAGTAFVLDRRGKRIWAAEAGGRQARVVLRGGQSGGLKNPVDLAVGPESFLYVLDRGHGAVLIYAPDGTFLRSVALPANDGRPRALTVARDGRLFVSYERAKAAVVSFSPFPRFGWASAGSDAPGELRLLSAPRARVGVGVAVSPWGTIVVADASIGRLVGADLGASEAGGGQFLYGGTGSGRGAFRQIADIAFAGPDQVAILDRELRKIERVRLPRDADEDLLPRFTFPMRPSRVRVGLPGDLLSFGRTPAGTTFMAYEAEPRLLRLLGLERTPFETIYGTRAERYEQDPDALDRTLGLFDLGELGDVAVSDTLVAATDPDRDRFVVSDLRSGERIGAFGNASRGPASLDTPRGIVFLPDGRLAVCDRGNDRVAVLDPDLSTVSASVALNDPHGLARAGGDTLYAWSENGGSVARIVLADSTVESVSRSLVPRPVAGIAVDQGGNVFSLDRETGRITVASPAVGGVLLQMGGAGGLESPRRILVDRHGNLYAVDERPGRSVVYRWDVLVPPLAPPRVTYEVDGARLSWEEGPAHLIRGYRVQASGGTGDGFRLAAVTDSPAARLEPAALGGSAPARVRVAPVLVTGEEGPPSEAVPLHHLVAVVARREDEADEALDAARRALAAIDEGRVGAARGVTNLLLWTAFESARELGRHGEAVSLGERLRSVVSDGRRVEFHLGMAESRLETDSPREAAEELLRVLEADPEPGAVADSAVRAASFRAARALGVGGSGDSARRGLAFLERYREGLPPDAEALVEDYADSLAVYRTRLRFREGFAHWRQARYPQVIEFFQGLDEARLSVDQRVLARQLTAAAYYALGRRDRAEEIFGEIAILKPGFDLEAESERLRRRYGLSLYSGNEMRRFFGRLAPGGGAPAGDSVAPDSAAPPDPDSREREVGHP